VVVDPTGMDTTVWQMMDCPAVGFPAQDALGEGIPAGFKTRLAALE
jgi:hypothetical protein